MASLYELTLEEKNLNELWNSAIDEETGEILDGEVLDQLEKEFETALVNKSAGIVKFTRQAEMENEMIDLEIKRLQALKKSRQKKVENFKNYIKSCMQRMELKKIETPLGNISLRQSTATDVYDASILPEEFLKKEITYKPMKTNIKNFLKDGNMVPGARLVINTSIKIG